MAIVERFSQKLKFKFKKIGDSFRFFDRNFDNNISFKEFRVVCEELDMRFNHKELKSVFDYMDYERNGSISYPEFTMLTDEKRLGKDPFLNQMKLKKKENKDKDLTSRRDSENE